VQSRRLARHSIDSVTPPGSYLRVDGRNIDRSDADPTYSITCAVPHDLTPMPSSRPPAATVWSYTRTRRHRSSWAARTSPPWP